MTQISSHEPRFVVLFHQPGRLSQRTREPHFDWMFEWEGRLRTWATSPIDWRSVSGSIEIECEPLPEHRVFYLDYEGAISGERGIVQRKAAGVYQLVVDRDDHFHVALRWPGEGEIQQADVEIYRSFFSGDETRLDDKRESWRLRFSPGR